MIFPGDISKMPYLTHGKSRAINAENRTGEKGKGGMAASPLGPSRKGSPCLNNIQPGQEEFLADIEGPGVIQHIWITVDSKTSEGDCFVLRDLIMRMYWDGEENPSVEVPLGDFFCCGFGQECIVNSAIITVVPSRGLNSYFAMPFHKHARITIENQHKNPIPAFFYQIDYCLYDSLPEDTSYFHAQWRRQAITEIGKDYVILDNVKGSGHYVGTYLGLSALQRYWWGEGEVKFYFLKCFYCFRLILHKFYFCLSCLLLLPASLQRHSPSHRKNQSGTYQFPVLPMHVFQTPFVPFLPDFEPFPGYFLVFIVRFFYFLFTIEL